MPGSSVGGLTIALVAALISVARPAHAGDNDIVLSRLGQIVTDDAGTPVDVVGSNQDFRSLSSELGVVLAPRLLTPADTLGFSGFQFTADVGYTSISNTAAHWRVLESSSDPTSDSTRHGSSLLPTIGAFMRKGLWLPTPSFEVGLGVVHLVDSQLWAAQGYAKLALHEGFHDLPLPSLAVRGGASRITGSSELDMTIASVDVIASKHFGVAGTWSVQPYGGWSGLIVVPRSQVVDKTPHISPMIDPTDRAMNFVFAEQDSIFRNRVFVGFEIQYFVFSLTAEAAFALAGSSVDDRAGTDMDCGDVTAPTTRCDATDQAGAQESYTLSVGLDF